MTTTKRTFLKATGAALVLGAAKAAPARPEPAERRLSGPWQFREAGEGEWLAATVPGTVHTDLLANGKIGNPFYRTNERDQQWIDKKDWEYRTTLELDAATLAHSHVALFFAGLDTFAEVYLNEALVLAADNMFREWTADIKAHAKPGANELRILFRSPITEGLKRLDALGYNPPAVVDWSEIGGLGDKHLSMFVRKAGYHFGWDWGPRFVTSGIWRPINLRAWSGVRIADLSIVQNSVTTAAAKLTAVFEIDADSAESAVLEIAAGKTIARASVTLVPGRSTHKIDFRVANPKLWWSNGLGKPDLTDFTGRVATDAAADIRTVRTGLRSLRIVQKPDANGTSFTVELNGVPVFMKGANYIPNDNFLPRVTRAIYERVVRSAADTNMNMLRVWGGGIYENDEFYDLCDEHGILIWQDFMFACVMYPPDKAFAENVRAEAADNIRRLRNHPCIALWCGNNEIDTAWAEGVPDGGWKWKEKYTPAQQAEMWGDYKAIFHQILPEEVAAHDPGRFYWPSSPLAAWDGTNVRHSDILAKEQSGDIHYWGVWWAAMPFSIYRKRVGRFMSEYGFQSFPEFKTIKSYADKPEDYDIFSEVMKAHQRSYIGNGTIKTYMERDYKVPKDFRQFLYVGQVLQAEGVRIAMEGHRARMPYCMGSLFWQINDCWPVASWSSIDYFGRWKALQYFARKSYARDLVTAYVEDGLYKLFVVSDRLNDIRGTLKLTLMDFQGRVLKTIRQPIMVAANTSLEMFTAPEAELLAGAAPETFLLHAELESGPAKLAETITYFRPVRDLALPAADVAVTVTPAGDGFAIGLSSPVLVKNLCLTFDALDGTFSDNYFDLLPGKPQMVTFHPVGRTDASALKQGLTLMHMAMVD